MGFSLPIDSIKKHLSQLKNKGRVSRGWLGVVVQDITLDAKNSLGLISAYGSLVREVVAKSPAHSAGVKRGDVIVEFDGFPIKNSIELPKRVANSAPGNELPIKLIREKKVLSLKVLLKEVSGAQNR